MRFLIQNKQEAQKVDSDHQNSNSDKNQLKLIRIAGKPEVEIVDDSLDQSSGSDIFASNLDYI